jgi:hypothetical protein
VKERLDRLSGRGRVQPPPSVRSSWAPMGKTSVLTHHFNWKRLSISAALCFRPAGSDASLIFGTQPGAYNFIASTGKSDLAGRATGPMSRP